jgi:hypothetical protein
LALFTNRTSLREIMDNWNFNTKIKNDQLIFDWKPLLRAELYGEQKHFAGLG